MRTSKPPLAADDRPVITNRRAINNHRRFRNRNLANYYVPPQLHPYNPIDMPTIMQTFYNRHAPRIPQFGWPPSTSKQQQQQQAHSPPPSTSSASVSKSRSARTTPYNVAKYAVPKRYYRFRVLRFEEVHPRSTINPKARSGHRMVADDSGDLYSFGGFNIQVPADDEELARDPGWQKHKPLFQELWKFSWRTKKWKKLITTGDVPDKLVSHCMTYWNEKIITYGGTGLPYGDNSSNRLTVYHMADKHWEVMEPVTDSTRSPVELYGQAFCCDKERGEIYVVGGTNGTQYSLDVHKFNLYTKKWTVLHKSTQLDYGPGCRYRHEIVLHNNKLYLFGGSTASHYYGFKDLPTFDLETNDWVASETRPFRNESGDEIYPKPRKCHSLAVIGIDCYVCGGMNGESICPDIWHINLDKLKWTLLVEHIPYPVYFHGATVSLEGKLTIFGGVDTIAGDSRNNKLTTIWLKIPTLKTICLHAVDHFVSKKILKAQAARSTGLLEAIEVAGLT